VQPDIVQVHSAAVHSSAESLVGFGLESVELCPADVEAVKAVRPQGRIGGWIKNSRFIEELLKVRGCQGRPIPLLHPVPPFYYSGCSAGCAEGPGSGRGMTPVTLSNVPGPRLEVQGGGILYCGRRARTVKEVSMLTKRGGQRAKDDGDGQLGQ
jgi:hypothetical protein